MKHKKLDPKEVLEVLKRSEDNVREAFIDAFHRRQDRDK